MTCSTIPHHLPIYLFTFDDPGSDKALFDELFERGMKLQEEMNNATLADAFVPGMQSSSNPDKNQNLSSTDVGPSFCVDTSLMEQDLVEMLVPTLLEAEKEKRQEERLMQRVLPIVAPTAFGGSALTEELTHVYAVSVLIQSVWLSERLRIKTVLVIC